MREKLRPIDPDEKVLSEFLTIQAISSIEEFDIALELLEKNGLHRRTIKFKNFLHMLKKSGEPRTHFDGMKVTLKVIQEPIVH